MKRLHVNLAVEDIPASVRFYTGLFGAEPTVLKPDYAKWMLDDPRVNFAIAARGAVSAPASTISAFRRRTARNWPRSTAASRPPRDRCSNRAT